MEYKEFHEFIKQSGIKQKVDYMAQQGGYLKPRNDQKYYACMVNELKEMLSYSKYNQEHINEAIKIAKELGGEENWSESRV